MGPLTDPGGKSTHQKVAPRLLEVTYGELFLYMKSTQSWYFWGIGQVFNISTKFSIQEHTEGWLGLKSTVNSIRIYP